MTAILEKIAFYWNYPFVRYALIVGVLIALCSSLLGVTLVLKRFSFIGDGLSHVAFGAMAIAAVLGLTDDMPLTLGVTVVCAVLLLRTGQNTKIKGDATIAMISVGALAIGYLLMNLFSTSSNLSGDVCSTLFGSTSILTLSKSEVWLCAGLSVVVVAVFLLYSAIAMVGILGMNRVDTGDRTVTSGSMDASYVKNVLVIGTDTRDPDEERGRSDSMILVSLNSKTHQIYMTSFMRDAYVDIPGQGSAKLNAAYSYGGPELLMDTIEENFDVHIDDYVMITFAACAAMIDAVGGVELEISDREAEAVNEILISEVNEIMGDDREDDLLDGGGKLKLDGKQALSYSRIRYVGNADFERTERQRTVMEQVMGKIKSNPFRLFPVCMGALPKMTTNMSVLSLYGYAVTTPLKLATYDMAQQRVPADGTYQGADIGGESVLQVDFDAAKQQLKSTVFAEK